jgi:hypothetical protein
MTARSHVGRARKALLLIAMCLVGAACGSGGGGGAPALAVGTEAVVNHANLGVASPAPVTSLGVTVKAVRIGTIADLEAGGFQVEEDQRSMTPVYVDLRFENKGTEAIDRNLGVSLRDQDDNLISSVVVFNYGGEPFATCTDNTTADEDLAPGEVLETCDLFLLREGRVAKRVAFLPSLPGTDTDPIYWAVP